MLCCVAWPCVCTDHVVTADNYTLGMFRIPYGRGQEPPTTRRPAVILQHGLEDSSYTWVNNFPAESLGFLLADAGYDVWLPNSRCVVCGAAWWLHRWFPTANCVIAQGKLLQHASEPVRLVLGFHLGM